MSDLDRSMLDRAARAGLRGFGYVEPNPMVGCAIGTEDGTLLALGHHRRFGGAHAEVDALSRCRAKGHDPARATCWVTLEPCTHHAKTPPCTDALLEAKIARVVFARVDPGHASGGGSEQLRRAGLRVDQCRSSPLASTLALPFIKRVTSGLPWVIAKWAQTIDGKIATRTGESRWISSATSRRDVHRQRGMASAILTAIGTVRADDPALTVRGVPARRTPLRIVIDPDLQTPVDSALMRSARTAPIVIAARDTTGAGARRLEAAGATILQGDSTPGGDIDLRALFQTLAVSFDVSTIFCEAGPRLLGRLISQDLADEALVYVAPRTMGDALACPALDGPALEALEDATTWSLWRHRVRAGDLHLRYIKREHLGVDSPD